MNSSNSLNWNEIIDRIFLLYNAKTNNELAAEFGFSGELIRSWRENNESKRRYPTLKTLEQVVCAHGVTWDWLLTGRDEENENSPPAPASGGYGISREPLAKAVEATSRLVKLLPEIAVAGDDEIVKKQVDLLAGLADAIAERLAKADSHEAAG